MHTWDQTCTNAKLFGLWYRESECFWRSAPLKPLQSYSCSDVLHIAVPGDRWSMNLWSVGAKMWRGMQHIWTGSIALLPPVVLLPPPVSLLLSIPCFFALECPDPICSSSKWAVTMCLLVCSFARFLGLRGAGSFKDPGVVCSLLFHAPLDEVTLQWTLSSLACCSVLQCSALQWLFLAPLDEVTLQWTHSHVVCCSVLQYVAVCCSVLQQLFLALFDDIAL